MGCPAQCCHSSKDKPELLQDGSKRVEYHKVLKAQMTTAISYLRKKIVEKEGKIVMSPNKISGFLRRKGKLSISLPAVPFLCNYIFRFLEEERDL